MATAKLWDVVRFTPLLGASAATKERTGHYGVVVDDDPHNWRGRLHVVDGHDEELVTVGHDHLAVINSYDDEASALRHLADWVEASTRLSDAYQDQSPTIIPHVIAYFATMIALATTGAGAYGWALALGLV